MPRLPTIGLTGFAAIACLVAFLGFDSAAAQEEQRVNEVGLSSSSHGSGHTVRKDFQCDDQHRRLLDAGRKAGER
jgi:hypothetical protein